MTDHEINALYQQQSNEKPSTELDKKILKLAQESVLTTSKTPVKKSASHYKPLTMVASFMLVGLLVLNFPDNYMNDNERPEPSFNHSTAEDLLQDESNLNREKSIKSRSTLKAVTNDQEISKFMPAPSSIAESKSKEAVISKKQQLQRSKISQEKLDKLMLLKQIANKLAAEQPLQAAKIAKKYVETFGIEQLPPKYHYLLK